MLHSLDPERASRIIGNLLDACRDITRLSLEAYRWINLRAGFIAHFDLDGFIEEYQTCQNLRENILANQIHNTSCKRSGKDRDYPYYLQQCEMYQQIVERLLADPQQFKQKKRTDEFCIELSKEKQEEIHKITLVTKRGTSSVFCDKDFLINLQNNISHYLTTCEHECIR
jgi:hypothetical protein